jgi:hypothetical protein
MNKYNNKGQAALEFLTTYGWAFLVILVMIGALAYFGVLDPSRYVSESCQLSGEIGCEAATVSATQFGISLTNNILDDVTVTAINLTDSKSGASCGIDNTGLAPSLGLSGSETASTGLVTWEPANCLTSLQGEKVNFKLTVTYNKGGSFALDQTATGTLIATVQ